MVIGDFFRKLVRKMFPKQTLEKKLNVQIATSAVMDNAIQLWLRMYQNQPPWLGGKAKVRSLNLPATISEEMARLVLTEFEIDVTGSARATFIRDCLDTLLTNMSNIIELWSALGGVVLKPYATGADPETGNPTDIMVDVVLANRFYPTAFDSNREMTGAVFVDTKRIGDYLYTRLEYHSLEGEHYTIINRAFRSERLYGATTEENSVTANNPFAEEVPLTSVDDWAGLEPKFELDDMEKPMFVYIKTPRANNVDTHSPLGASVFARAVEVIEEADKQYSRTLWEYEAKEAAIDADETMFKKVGKRFVLPEGRERLFRLYSFDDASKGGFLQAYSPEIRDSSMFNGLNKLFREVESLCGLAYGTISDVNEVERTATEVKSSKHRSYTTIDAMQTAWEKGLTDLIAVMDHLCWMYELTPEGKIDTTITWGDGVLEDTEAEYQRRWQMVMAGRYKLEKFYAWYFGCSEEEALDMIPQASLSPFPPEE